VIECCVRPSTLIVIRTFRTQYNVAISTNDFVQRLQEDIEFCIDVFFVLMCACCNHFDVFRLMFQFKFAIEKKNSWFFETFGEHCVSRIDEGALKANSPYKCGVTHTATIDSDDLQSVHFYLVEGIPLSCSVSEWVGGWVKNWFRRMTSLFFFICQYWYMSVWAVHNTLQRVEQTLFCWKRQIYCWVKWLQHCGAHHLWACSHPKFVLSLTISTLHIPTITEAKMERE
jgi:hypothetical protein